MLERMVAYKNQWVGLYTQNILAGILMALALLPVTIAFSFIVHISPTKGMLSCGLMMILISLLGKRISMVSGPSSGISIIGGPLVAEYNVNYLISATIIMGIILIIFGLFKIDKILKKIPNTVVMGFMNALGILLLTTQIKYIFNISISTYLVTIVTFVIIFISSKLLRSIPAPLIAIIVVTFLTWIFNPKIQYVSDLANIHITLPELQTPLFLTHIHTFMICLIYGLTMAIIAVIQTNLTHEMMNTITQTNADKDKEVVSQGISNVIVGFLGGYGSSALVGQSKFNYKMGATTRLSNLVTGLFLMLCIVLLGPLVSLIPMAVLACVLITVSFSTFDRRTIPHIKERPIEHTIVMGTTMLLILLTNNLAVGVVIGTIIYYMIQFILKRRDVRHHD